MRINRSVANEAAMQPDFHFQETFFVFHATYSSALCPGRTLEYDTTQKTRTQAIRLRVLDSEPKLNVTRKFLCVRVRPKATRIIHRHYFFVLGTLFNFVKRSRFSMR